MVPLPLFFTKSFAGDDFCNCRTGRANHVVVISAVARVRVGSPSQIGLSFAVGARLLPITSVLYAAVSIPFSAVSVLFVAVSSVLFLAVSVLVAAVSDLLPVESNALRGGRVDWPVSWLRLFAAQSTSFWRVRIGRLRTLRLSPKFS